MLPLKVAVNRLLFKQCLIHKEQDFLLKLNIESEIAANLHRSHSAKCESRLATRPAAYYLPLAWVDFFYFIKNLKVRRLCLSVAPP